MKTSCASIFFCVSVFFCISVFPDLQWPLKEKTYLTGSFGEFRKKHIHAGIDISTHSKTGMPVYAGENGFVCRVKTEYKGFGKAVYIKLENGNILVYAHLERFSPEIEEAVKNEQLKNNKYAVDFNPERKIYIKKAELIGYSGDTGGVAPHLHLELRDPDERPINILQNGLRSEDKTAPVITGLALCDPETTYCKKFYSLKQIPSEIHIEGKTGLAVSVYDSSKGNTLGAYQLDLFIDGKLFFTVKMDGFSYDEFYDNFLLCNKDLYVNHDRIFYHLFRAFNNKLSFYPAGRNGILDLSPGRHSLEIRAADNTGNISSVKFNIVYTAQKIIQDKVITTGWTSEDKLCRIHINKEDQYYPIKMTIKEKTQNKNTGELIPVSKIYDTGPKKAVFKKASVSVTPQAKTDKTGLYKFEDGKWKYMDDNTVKNFTQFALFKDNTSPTIKIISRYPMFRAKIEDNGSGLDYEKLELLLDKKKVIAEYSINRKELFYKMPLKARKISCTAVDKAGNANNFSENIDN